VNGLEQPVIAVRVPIWRGSGQAGVLGLAVTVSSLSRELDELARTVNATPFILSGRDRVVAHPNLGATFGRRDAHAPLPALDQVNDPLLAGMWEGGDRIDNQRSRNLFGGLGRIKRIDGRTYLFAYREIDKYGGPWLIGLIQAEATLGTALDRIWDAMVAGVVVLVLAFLMALFYARWITRHLRAFAGQARAVRDFDFETERRLQRSRLREIDDTAQAFNAMIDGLKWFESYVPRQLVRRLMRSGDGEGVASVQRDLSVMFTDIAGFTTLSETMSAGEVASFLNHHFGLLAGVIDREDGTVDKHLGDGIMAFWGAPEPMQDHALRACQAALAIRAAVEEDNRRRRAEGLPTIRVRIGIQSGGVTVGNIGAASRLSYTIVGDAVNAASRLCELAKQLDPEAREVPIAIGDETVARLDGEFDLRSMGDWVLRGRRGNTEVFELCGAAAAGPAPAADALARATATG
jgi:class 3 adenylate cyclase